MLATYAKRLTPALLAVAALSLSAVTCSSAAIAQTATTVQAEDPPAGLAARVVAAREYLRAIGYKTFVEAKIAAAARTKIAFKIMLEREPILEDQEAKIIAARFTAEELREASKFQSSATGALYRSFNREMSANPFTTPEIYRGEIAKRFTPEQRAVVFTYVSSFVYKKWQLVQPDLTKAEKEIGEQWDHQTQEAIEQAVRAGDDVS